MENMPATNGLAVTSVVLGVLSMFFVMVGLSLPLGALGIITAFLSRGNGQIQGRAKAGLALSLLGITLGICVLIWSYRMMNSAEFTELMNQYQQLYGF